jgi:hypothetical protein
MKAFTVMRWTIGGTVAASAAFAATVALAQMRIYPNGTDCSKLPISQQTDCKVQQRPSAAGPDNGYPPLPATNGTGTNQHGTLGPNGSSGQTNGSTLGTGGGNGGASPPGQTGN